MASDVEICNGALQKLGAKRIVNLAEDSTNARACNNAYARRRDALLRSHPWNFAIKRRSLAADSDAPDFGRANAFQLPSDFIRLLPPYPEDNLNSLDWQIEGRKIYSDDDAPLEIRYLAQIIDPNEMDALFREALAADLAHELCEEITQSNTKKSALKEEREIALRLAKRTNAIENVSAEPPEDVWLTARA